MALFGAFGVGVGGGGGGGGVAAHVDFLKNQPYLNLLPNVNGMRGIARDQALPYPDEYAVALQFQRHYEPMFDVADAAGLTPMERFINNYGGVDPLDHMAYPNVAFIMTIFEWAGVNATNGDLFAVGSAELGPLNEPMSSVHMGMYCRHLKSLRSRMLFPPDFAEVNGVCDSNVLFYNGDGEDFCNASVEMQVTDATNDHGYYYSEAATTLFHSAAFGRCLFRFNMARCVQRS